MLADIVIFHEKNFRGPLFDKFRDEGIVVFTAFAFETEKREIKVWMDEALMGRLKGGQNGKQWGVGLWRSDTWEPCFVKSQLVGSEVERGRVWGSGV